MTLPLTLALVLDRAAGPPLSSQVAGQIRDGVLAGTLPVGARLPSTRALATDLRVSRAVTEQAFDQLAAEGWIEGRHGSGTFVAAGAGARPHHRPARVPAPESALLRLDTGTPWIDPRHRAAWRRAWRDVSAAPAPPSYDDPAGLRELRVELATHLARARGLLCDPDEILVTTGTIGGLNQLLAALPPGDVGHEDPGYRAAAEAILASGRALRDLPAAEPVTDLGGVVAAYVTPAHQHPLGPVMPGSARLALIDAAARAGAVVIEDDYDSEFRYDVAPVPALAALDRDRVAYLGTTSKTVAPSMRLGWLVAPTALHRAILARGRSPMTSRRGRSSARSSPCSATATSTRSCAPPAGRTPPGPRGSRDVLRPHAEPILPVAGMYATVPMPQSRALAPMPPPGGPGSRCRCSATTAEPRA